MNTPAGQGLKNCASLLANTGKTRLFEAKLLAMSYLGRRFPLIASGVEI
jgi:hypothetical protein